MITVRARAEVGLWAKPVQEWMSRRVVAVEPTHTARFALQAMLDHGRRHVLVREGARLVGIVCQRDILGAAGLEPYRPLDLGRPVEQIMTRAPLASITPDQALARAAWLMRARDVGVLPVIGPAGQVLGILTSDDVLRAIPGAGRLRRGSGLEL